MQTIARETFSTSREMEFFTPKELTMQIGCEPSGWPVALLKELVDNALDACESSSIAPDIAVAVEGDAVSVLDNGPGMPIATLERSLDYLVRVSDKNHYIAPTRGQLGNALKCVWAAAYVAGGGECGRVDVTTGGLVHTVNVTLDRIAQQPRLAHVVSQDGLVKNGTLVKMHWPGIAGLLNPEWCNSYKGAFDLVCQYAAFNPHATIRYTTGDCEPSAWTPSAADWRKWAACNPTSPHWYTVNQLRGLIAAYIAKEQDGGKARTVRDFVSEFYGLSGTAKQKSVTDSAGLAGAYLHDLVGDGDIDRTRTAALLDAMQAESRPVNPKALGAIGEEHLSDWMQSQDIAPDSIKYQSKAGFADGLPYVVEVAFGIFNSGRRMVVTGLNWSPTLSIPFADLSRLLGEARVDSCDPVMILVHLACPHLVFTDRGKSKLDLPSEISAALAGAVGSVTKAWKRAKIEAGKEERVRQRDLDEMRRARKRQFFNVKEAAYQVMEAAYLKASNGGALPANARQIMYAARPGVLELTGGKCWKKSAYFTQTLLNDFIEGNPQLTAGWDVVFDARGHITEPHTGGRVDLGTLAVRRYISDWHCDVQGAEIPDIGGDRVCTIGPANRYKFALFCEKEGFDSLFESVQLADRFDIAIMSTKGMSNTASRQLVDRLSRAGVTILVLHDFDKAGFSIFKTLTSNTQRYRFRTPPKVIDVGLRLADVEAMNLQSEPVIYDGKVDPKANLRESGATEEECDFLVSGRCYYGGPWEGKRVELNAMTSDQLVTWLERKFEEHGVTKVIPDQHTLEAAYKRARKLQFVQDVITKALADYDADKIVPGDLGSLVTDRVKLGEPIPWDEAVWDIARQCEKEEVTQCRKL